MQHKFASLLAVALAALLAVPSSASAGAGDQVFEKIKGVLVSQVDPDAIEMARFSIARPAEAAIVYSRAAAQDYPFFALVGAVKAAKNRDFPQIGTFTYEKCMTPITAMDSVFAAASSTIDDAQGKASTNAAMATASGIAAQYAKAQSAQAKQQLIEQLSQRVPYFGDIPTICAFAFETDLQAERNLNQVASQLSQDIRTAYFYFKSGDVVSGTAVLVSLGVGKQAVCSMVDAAVAGGAIGRTPVLGALARDACAGFVGTVLDGVTGIVKGGVGAFEAGVLAVGNAGKAAVCAAYSLIGSGCSSAEPPPTAIGNANAWCTAHGGMAAFLSASNQPDDYLLECNDGSKCRARPGQAARCATGEEIAAREAQRIAQNEAEFRMKLPQWQAEFDARWLSSCPDEACKAGIRMVRLNASLLATKAHEERPDYLYQMATYFPFEAADRQAVGVIDDSDYRVRPPRWAEGFRARVNERCEDNQCRAGVQLVAANTQLLVQQRASANPRPPYGETAALFRAAESQADTLVAESIQRSADFNKTTTADAGVAWEQITNSVWGKQCADARCVGEVKQLSALMRTAANLLQMADPDASSLSIQGKVGSEYGPKFKAAVAASQARAAAMVPAVPPTNARAVGALESFVQRRSFAREQPRTTIRSARAPTTPTPAMRPVRPPAPAVGTTMYRMPTTTAPRSVSMEAGTDRMGGDYRGFALDRPSAEVCRQTCAAEASCRAYTFVEPGLKGPKAMCFLKNVVPPATLDACCTSGAKTESPRR